jgi:hypothetical protein
MVVTEGDIAVRFRGGASVPARNLRGRLTVPWPFGRLAIAAEELTLTARLFGTHELDLDQSEEHVAYPIGGHFWPTVGVGINAHDEVWFGHLQGRLGWGCSLGRVVAVPIVRRCLHERDGCHG